MRSLLAVLALGAVVACDRDPVQPSTDLAPNFSATSVRDVSVQPIAWDWYNKCLDETMHFSGTVLVSFQWVTTPNDTRLNIRWRFRDGSQLVGLTTNDVWLTVPGDHGINAGTALGDFLTMHERLVFRNPTTGVVLEWSSSITFVTNARGEVTVDRMNYLDDCTLRH